MWMQLLQAAGFPPIGDAFPRNWETTIKHANPAGFWESKLRRGIYYATNPDPQTGTYLFPEQTERHAVKVFVPGLIKTDRAFIGRVIATVRPWRQYLGSIERLYAMERENLGTEATSGASAEAPVHMDPVIEWWVENFSLISDIVTRRYPFYMVAYEEVLRDPETTLRSVFDWMEEGDIGAAVDVVVPRLRTQELEAGDRHLELPEGAVETFDALYETVTSRTPIDQALVDRLNDTNERLAPIIEREVRRVAEAQLRKQRRTLATKRTGDASS